MEDYIITIDSLCKKFNIEDIPALRQLRKAYELGDEDGVKRIGGNIIHFINEIEKSE